MTKCPITTHVLDTSRGCPASGLVVDLRRVDGSTETTLGSGTTDQDGRITSGLLSQDDFRPATYMIRFKTGDYFQACGCEGFFPEVTISFHVTADQEHYHVPLLLSPFAYSTYRGS
ncbi:MAG: hydroxyisourate hydrolase [Planctomycetota bacterium]